MTLSGVAKSFAFEIGYVFGGILMVLPAPFIAVYLFFQEKDISNLTKILISPIAIPFVFGIGVIFGCMMPFGLFRYCCKKCCYVEEQEKSRDDLKIDFYSDTRRFAERLGIELADVLESLRDYCLVRSQSSEYAFMYEVLQEKTQEIDNQSHVFPPLPD